MACEKLNKRYNAKSKKEQARLRSEFNEPDIMVPHPRNPNVYYIKGRLQTTRCIGDFYLKSAEFNFNPKI